MMNHLFFHVLPLCVMIVNCTTNYWVYWEGTVEVEGLIPVSLQTYWGIYDLDIKSNLLGKQYISMGIPDFIEFTTDTFDIQIMKSTTLPLYYVVYILYIVCILWQAFHVSLAIREGDMPLGRVIVNYPYVLYTHIVRNIASVFLLWALFTYYDTDALCLGGYIDDSTMVVNVEPDNEICTYSWGAVTIIGTEVMILMFSAYLYKVFCKKTRFRSKSSSSVGELGLEGNHGFRPDIPLLSPGVSQRRPMLQVNPV